MKSMPIPLENYELPKKLTLDSPMVKGAEETLKVKFPDAEITSRLVLADYVCHVTAFSSKGNVLQTIVVNENVYLDWNNGVIFSNRRKFTYGDTVITTLDHSSYCEYVVNWDLNNASISSKDNHNVVFYNNRNDKPIVELDFYIWLGEQYARQQGTTIEFIVGDFAIDIRRYLAVAAIDNKIITLSGGCFQFERDFISHDDFETLTAVHETFFREIAAKECKRCQGKDL